jgi:hypothetical protein
VIKIGISIQAWSAPHGDLCVTLDVFRDGRARCKAEVALAFALLNNMREMTDKMAEAVVASGMAVQFSDGTLVAMQPDPTATTLPQAASVQ